MSDQALSSSRHLQRLLVFLVFVSPFIYWGALRDLSALPRNAFIVFTAGIGLTLWAWEAIRRRQGFVWHPWFGTLLLMYVWSAISIGWSVDPDNGFVLLANLTGLVTVGFLVMQVGEKAFGLAIAKAAVLAGALSALVAIGQYFGYDPLHYWQAVAPAGSFVNKNFLALYLDLIVPIGLMLSLMEARPRLRWLWGIATALCLSFLIVSRTRGSWLGLLAAGAAAVVMLWRIPALRAQFHEYIPGRRWMLAAIAALPIVLALMPGDILPHDYKTGQLLKGRLDSSIETRLHAYENSLALIADHPLQGTGFGGFRMGFRPYMFSVAPMYEVTEDKQLGRLHSDPLQQFVELGLPGGLLSLALYGWALWLAWSLARDAEGETRWLAAGLFLALIASGAHACVSFPLHKPNSALMWVVWLGLLAGLAARRRQRPLPSPWSPILALMGLLGLGIAAGAVAFYTPYIQANRDMKTAILAQADKDCPKARHYIDTAWSRFRLDFEEREQYVRTYAFCGSDANRVLTAMNEVLAYDPTNARALLTRGQIELSRREYRQAADDFGLVASILPHRASGYLGLGHVARHLGKLRLARRLYRTAQDREPNNPLPAKFLKMLDKPQSQRHK